ncbi:hypothetical protein HNQ02_003639 [Flavobacterium sp. 7E]|uniref:hypothetical protein n=1 Tax=Flavobacterium sp. 7E TaxID=2735898 RepID=UPI0015702F05|nr:hypothetical protein [Flavobacterium sp. 7E]NRS90692.1 hypothetical protein [Flavobacterium sp. 7E]
MKRYKIAILLMIFIVLNTSCQSNNKNMQENNKIVVKWNDTDLYSNQKVAYKKNDSVVSFYSLSDNSIYAEINLKSFNSLIYNQEIFNTRELIKINKFNYFSPKKYSENYTLPLGNVGTGLGSFYTYINYNELGLINNILTEYPEENSKFLYYYNKYGQLLKIVEDKFIDKTLLENEYDEKARLIFQEENYEDSKSKKIFYYDEKDNITKQNIINDKINYSLLYEYNPKLQLIKKYSEDKNYYFEYSYDNKGMLTRELQYKASIDKNNPSEIINYFIETNFEYNNSGSLVKETISEIPYINKYILVNKEWQPLNLDEQKKDAWKEYNKKGNFFFRYIKTISYKYLNNNIISSEKNVIKNESDGNIYHSVEQVHLNEKIKYTYNDLGQVIKKEIFEQGKFEPDNVQEYSY